MSVKYGFFALLIMSAPIAKANKNTFIDEHFAQDSALVLLNGAFLSSVIEALCLRAPVRTGIQPVSFCQGFAPEVVTFVHLTKSQWTPDMTEIWSNLNMLLLGLVLFYANDSPIEGIRKGVMLIVYSRAARTLAISAASWLRKTKQQNREVHIKMHGVSSGLMAGALSLLFTYRNAWHYQLLTLLASSLGTTLVTTSFYVTFGDSEQVSDSTGISAVAGAGVLVGVVAGAGALVGAGILPDAMFAVSLTAAESLAAAGALTEVLPEALAVALAEPWADAVSDFRAFAGARIMIPTRLIITFRALAGAFAGARIMITTRLISTFLLQHSDGTAIRRGLAVTAAAGLPLMVSSWLISFERFVKDNTPMHETMQNEYIFSMPVSKALSFAKWVN